MVITVRELCDVNFNNCNNIVRKSEFLLAYKIWQQEIDDWIRKFKERYFYYGNGRKKKDK